VQRCMLLFAVQNVALRLLAAHLTTVISSSYVEISEATAAHSVDSAVFNETCIHVFTAFRQISNALLN